MIMNRKIILFLLILVSICAISNVSAADNLTDTDTGIMEAANDADEITISDDKLSNNEYRNLQETINQAKENETITLDGSTYNCDYLININKTITIDGNGSTLIFNGEGKDYTSTFFYINYTASNVVLKNLKFIGGNFLFGGAITWHGDYGSVINCTFENNLARGNNAIGGAIFVLGDNCNIINSTFINNNAHEYGGAILWNGTNGIINTCEFIGNVANGEKRGQGGALVLRGDNCTVINSNFTKNSATFMGGAISVSDSSNSRIINCNFDGNYLINRQFTLEDYAGGGAIYSACNALTVDRCNFTNNYGNSTGGAIHLSVNDTVKNSFFNKNHAIKDESGYEYGNDIVYTGNLNNYNHNVISNTFILDYGESEQYAAGVNYKEILETIIADNTFIQTKLNSTISFSAGIIFDYGTTSSPIQINVVGGVVEKKNIKVIDHPEAVITFSNNALSVSNLPVGQYTLFVSTTPDEGYAQANSTLNIIVNKATAVLSASSISVVLKKSGYMDITLIDSKYKKPIKNMEITLKVFTGNKFNVIKVKTDSNGVAHFKTSSLAKGNHKIVITGTHAGYNFNTVTSYINVVKPKALKFKLYKRVNSKSGSIISFQVLDKKTKKGVNGVKVIFMIKTGKKYSTMVLKTKSVKSNGKKIKGMTGFFSNKFSVGKHTVIVKPVSIKYSGSGKSSITIKKTAKKYPSKTTKL